MLSPMEHVEDCAVAAWEQRIVGRAQHVSTPTGPYADQLAGHATAAASAWDALGCGYHAALALLDAGTEESLREALRRFEELGADAATQLTRRQMRSAGIKSVPNGARASTREHPVGLTRREGEVLELVTAGRTNEEIAASLFISIKTVDHHVSAVLAKLGVPSRHAAAREAERLGLAATPR
jgi:DNA-binding NarL/FixJ family response regulator